MSEDLIITAEEAREAAELASELEDGGVPASAELASVVVILRRSARSGELSDDAEEKVLRRVLGSPALSAAPSPARADRRVIAPRRVAWLAVAAAAAAVAVAVWAGAARYRPSRSAPSPTADLLSAQASAIGGGGSMGPLEHEMTLYRETLYTDLETRYGVKP